MFKTLKSGSGLLQPDPDNLATAVAQVKDANLFGQQQESVRREVLDFCTSHTNALHRRCSDGHLTASCLVVNHQRSHLLVIRHTKLRRWLQPGGHADGNGNLRRVAWDEATEETGIANLAVVTPAIDIDIHPIPAVSDDPQHMHFDLRFLLLAPEDAEVATNHESTDFGWVTPASDVVADEPGLVRALRRALDVVRTLPA